MNARSGAAVGLAATALTGCGGGSQPTAVPPQAAPPTAVERSIDLGARLYVSDGCSACHTTDGRPGVGPSFDGLYKRRVDLGDGRHVIATRAFLRESLRDPAANALRGYPSAPMSAAVRRAHLSRRGIKGLVDFIEALVPAG